MKRFISFLNSKLFSIIVIILSFASRFISVLYASYAGGDKMSLAIQSRNLLSGKGLSITKYFLSDLSAPVYDFTPLWPPGYPILLAPLLKIFDNNLYAATTTFDLIVSAGLILIIRKIAFQLRLQIAYINILTLIAGCFEYPFITESLPTDTVSLLFYLTGISFSLKIIEEKNRSIAAWILTGFLIFLPCFFRYAYQPLSAGVPLVIILYGWMLKNKTIIKKGIVVLTTTMLFIALLSLSLKISTGSAQYITPTQSGFFPENIVHWYPLVPASFIDLPVLTSQVIKYTAINLTRQIRFLEILNILFIGTGLFFFCFVFMKKKFQSPAPLKWLALWFIAISILVFLTLGYLSLTNEAQRGFLTSWNYVYEARYYAPVTVFIQLLFILWVSRYKQWKKYSLLKLITAGLGFLLLIEVVHSIYFYSRVAFNFKSYKEAVYREQDYNYFNTLLKTLHRDYPGREILVAAPNDKGFLYMAIYHGDKGIFDGAKLKTTMPVVKNNSLLVTMLFDQELNQYSAFLSKSKAKFLNRVHNSNFFLTELMPD